MPSVVDMGLLDRLDRLIRRYRLHEGDRRQPVNLERVLEGFVDGYWGLPGEVQAVTARWKGRRSGTSGRRFTRIAFDWGLKEPEESARKRHAGAHELAHVIGRHRGDLFVMWRPEREPAGFEKHMGRVQERQCEYIAAYLLVPLGSLKEMEHEEGGYVARVLDVPEHLVRLRWEIWQRFGR